MSVRRLSHIGIAVADLDDAIRTYSAAFGLEPAHRERVESEGIATATFVIGEVEIELMQPLDAESAVGRFIAKRGEGVHHLAFAVPDVGEALERARTAGLQLVDESPRSGLGGRQVAFIHPRGLHGILAELVEER